MKESVERIARVPAVPADALRGAAATFGISLILFISLVGLKTENVAEGLTVTTHLGKAFLLAALVTVIRFLLDILIWRRPARTTGIQERAYTIGRAGAAIAFAVGGFLFLFSGLRTSLVGEAGDIFWLLGTVVDMATFGAMAAFALFVGIGIVRIFRLALGAMPAHEADAGKSIWSRFTKNIGQEFPIALFMVAVLLPALVVGPPQRYAIDTATQILIYVMLGWGLNVVVGLAGLLDLGYVAFYAVGAYAYALLSTRLDWSFWACLPLAGFLAALWGITLGFPVLRLRGDYLAIVTLAFGEIVRIVLVNWQSFTGGPNGIQLPKLTFFGLPFSRGEETNFFSFFGLDYDPVYRIIFLYYVILVLALITNFVTLRLRRLPIGRAWEALREDEIACRSLGINTVTTKLSAFAIGAMFGGFAGAFFAARLGFITPESFTFQESALVLAIVVLGGLGSQMGVVIAAVALVGSAERFRELQDYRMLIFGLSMVLIMTWRPRGLMARRTPSAVLRETRSISSSLVTEGRG